MTSDELADLEFAADDMIHMGEQVLTRAAYHVASLPEQPSRGDLNADTLCRSLREPAPEEPSSLRSILDSYFEDWLPRSLNTPSPGYLAYIPGGGVFPAAIADLLSNITNRYTGVRWAAPALVQLEENVTSWFCSWMGFPPSAGGILTTGGSMANLSAIVCARERHLGTNVRRGVVYVSEQAHHSVVKSARMAGIFPDQIRMIPVDDALRMRVDALQDEVRRDRNRAESIPFLVVSAAGTTNTGVVDPLHAIADLCAQEGLWHHVDGAYGAFFHLCEELRPVLAGLPRADSLTLDPHKGLFLPYGTGALLVRDRQTLRDAYGPRLGGDQTDLAEALASYMPDVEVADEFFDPASYGPELSRDFRGLRVWLTVKLYGLAKIRAALREKRRLAVDAAQRVSKIPGIVVLAPPQLSLFAFYMSWQGATRDQEDVATQQLLERVNDRGKVMLSGCRVGGRKLARVCVLSFRTHQDRIDDCVQHIQEESAEILKSLAG